MIDELLAQAQLNVTQLTGLAYGRGPGSFTGLRIAAGVVQGIAFGADLPVAPISSLAALAQGAASKGINQIIAVTDARMHEVYCGRFRLDLLRIAVAAGVERCVPPEHLPPLSGGQWIGVGTGFKVYGEALQRRLGACLVEFDGAGHINARDIVVLAEREFEQSRTVDAAAVSPVYLRDTVVHDKS